MLRCKTKRKLLLLETLKIFADAYYWNWLACRILLSVIYDLPSFSGEFLIGTYKVAKWFLPSPCKPIKRNGIQLIQAKHCNSCSVFAGSVIRQKFLVLECVIFSGWSKSHLVLNDFTLRFKEWELCIDHSLPCLVRGYKVRNYTATPTLSSVT